MCFCQSAAENYRVTQTPFDRPFDERPFVDLLNSKSSRWASVVYVTAPTGGGRTQILGVAQMVSAIVKTRGAPAMRLQQGRSLFSVIITSVLLAGLFSAAASAAPKGKVNWSACFRDFGPFQCASVGVPLDHDDPNGA